jgi:Dolichyl-phosphate-mannose-protein mannosyltransferase
MTTNSHFTSETDPIDLNLNEAYGSRHFAFFYDLRDRLASAFSRLANVLEAHPVISFTLLIIVVIPGELGRSLKKPLWFDELFTFYISQASSLSTLFKEIRLIDLNPPLSYLLTRVSMSLFGINTLSCRLPEMAGFLLAMLSLFLFVRRRAGTLYGLLAATLLYTGGMKEFAVEARPYGLLLGFGSLSLLAWQKARAHDRFAIPLLLLGGFGMLLTHVFGVYLWCAFAAAEFLRILLRRRIEWSLVIAWAVPLVSIATYIPLLRAHGTGIYPPSFLPNARTIVLFYENRIEREASCVLLTALIMLVLAGRRALQGERGWFLSVSEWASIIFLTAIPILLIVELRLSHSAFFSRYGTPASIGISIVGAVLLAKWTRQDTRAALVCILVALLTSGELRFSGELPSAAKAVLRQHIFKSTEPSPQPCETCTRTAALDASIPLVDASGLTFLEMDNREDPSTLSRVFYLTDPVASVQYAHANIFEVMPVMKSLFPIRANVSPYSDFIQHHRHFFVLGDYHYPEDWLLRKLQADGATLRMLGTTENSYNDKDLYEVIF